MNIDSILEFVSRTLAILSLMAGIVLAAPGTLMAQSSTPRAAPSWDDLGYRGLPENFSTDQISLFTALNKARGTWTFSGSSAETSSAKQIEGTLTINGNPQQGMVAAWQVAREWPSQGSNGQQSRKASIDMIMASPKKTAFDLMLVRIGPMDKSATAKPKSDVPRSMFRGQWNPNSNTITWTALDLPGGLGDSSAQAATEKPRPSFKMVVATDGKIAIRESKHIAPGELVSCTAITRTGKPPAKVATLTGKHDFKTVDQIKDARIKPWLPPQATEISVISERGGHFARYKIPEAEFLKFLDQLWADQGDGSAHQRENMSGEGEMAKQVVMARRFQSTGWKPLKNAVIYYSPSKSSGAMTTYYYDRESGVAFHDRGYW